MERAQFRLQQLAAHLQSENPGSVSFMACMGGARRHSRVDYARVALSDARFARPAQDVEGGSTEEVKQAPPPARQENEKAKGTDLVSPPLFSKPSTRAVAPPVSEPLFSRSSSLSPQEVEKEKEAAALAWAAAEEQPSHPETESIGKGYEWFPRMDVVESGSAYVVTVELPGVNVDGICCEVTFDSLVISGSRSTDWWKNNGDNHNYSNGNGSANGNGSVYHRRDLQQGPYRAVWRLPKNADVGAISAEFIEGFLRVVVPKTRIVRYM